MLWVVKRNDTSNWDIGLRGSQEVLLFLSSKERDELLRSI